MGLYIPGLKMPPCCMDCIIANFTAGYCPVCKSAFILQTKRDEKCPLVEVLPHGDLISRNEALSHPFANGQYDHEHAPLDFILGHESYKEWLEELPIIVPADKENLE